MKLQQKQVPHRTDTIAFGRNHFFCWKTGFFGYYLEKLIQLRVPVPPVLDHYFLAIHDVSMVPSSIPSQEVL